MRCVIPSISNVSLTNIIFRLTLFVNNSFELGFCFIPCTLHKSHLLWKNCLSQPFFVFQKVAIILNETLRDYTIMLFEPHPLRHLWIWSRNHGAIVGSMKQNFFTVCGHEVILQQSLFRVLLLSSINSSQREYLFYCLLQWYTQFYFPNNSKNVYRTLRN